MTETEDERRKRRHAQMQLERARIQATEDGVSAWAALHDLKERDGGDGWCGHNLLGKRPNWVHQSQCASEGPSWGWWDHVRGFGHGRRQLVLLAWPYGPRTGIEAKVREYADRLGLNWHVGHSEGPLSLYFWGAATPWIISAPDVDAAALFAATCPELEDAISRVAGYASTRDDRQASHLRERAAR